jgi:hypothetical protein
MTKNKFETNEQFVMRIMNTGSPLRQAFVIEAISQYADACAKAKPEDINAPFLNGAAWIQVARELKTEVDSKYGATSKPEAKPLGDIVGKF